MKAPPVGEAFLGVWVDRLPDPQFVIHYGDRYWEYAPTLQPPVGSALYAETPAWWIEMPGAAE
jgi:hypothetical protein